MSEYLETNFHLRDEALNEYLDGELSSEDMAVLQEHLDGCSACAARLETLRYVFTALEDLPDLPLVRDFSPEIERTIYLQGLRPLHRWPLNLAFVFQSLATIVLLIFAWPFITRSWQSYLTDVFPRLFSLSSEVSSALRFESLSSTWSSAWEQAGQGFQSFVIEAGIFWDGLARFQLGMQWPLISIMVLLAAASVLWLLGNGLLLRSGSGQDHTYHSSGG